MLSLSSVNYTRYRAADNKRWFLKNHWIDLLTSIPIPPTELSVCCDWAGALNTQTGGSKVVSTTQDT